MVGQLHPSPERIPHSGSMGSMHHGKSPMKEVFVESCDNLANISESEHDDEGISPSITATITTTAVIDTIHHQQTLSRGERGPGLAP